MIEFCTKKRMAIAIVFMTGISVLVLVLENRMTMSHELKDVTNMPIDNTSAEYKCWEYEKYEVLHQCTPCNTFEMKSKSSHCANGYKQEIKCVKKGIVFRSCPSMSGIQSRNFNIFEVMAFLVGLVSYGVVFMRQKRLDRLLLDKVHKQIAAGV